MLSGCSKVLGQCWVGHSLAGIVEVMGAGGSGTWGLQGLETLLVFIPVHGCTPPRSTGGPGPAGLNPSDSLLAGLLEPGPGLGDSILHLRVVHMPSLYIYFGSRGTHAMVHV